MTEKYEDLLLDAYFPPESDKRDKRPAVIFAHGGGFKGGNKQVGKKLAEQLTVRGYAVFSINYRLTGEHWSMESQQAVHDA